jgi:acetyl-CoA synthetase
LLKKLGVKKRDVVAIYMPLLPQAVVAMLACARIGAIHSVVFSAFSAEALKTRLKDGKAKVLITADGYYRRGKKENLKHKADEAIKGTKVKKVLIVNRVEKNPKYKNKKYVLWEEVDRQSSLCEPVYVESNTPLFILYTSGTTGKPKGIVHDTGGYLVQAYWTAKLDFDLHEKDVMWCTADIGWITGHTYAVYGPLSNGSTSLIYEGAPDYPNPGRWWEIIQENNVSVFYTAPTAIRMFMKFGDKWPKKYDLKSLKVLGSVGEPIDVESWMWYFNTIGKGKRPVIDTWWQTETGGTLINALPGIGPFIPTVAGKSFPGTRHAVVDENGKEMKPNKSGYLVQLSPFAPGLLRGVHKNKKKYKKTYWSKFKNKYDSSDKAHYDKNGYIRIEGRADDVMKVAGHRLATAELENAIDQSRIVNECGVVSMPDKIRGEVPIAFVVLKKSVDEKEYERLEKDLKKHVDSVIGPTARPKKVFFIEDLPKTRSGKIMRRILKNLINKEKPKGLMTLVNPEAVDKIKISIEKGFNKGKQMENKNPKNKKAKKKKRRKKKQIKKKKTKQSNKRRKAKKKKTRKKTKKRRKKR